MGESGGLNRCQGILEILTSSKFLESSSTTLDAVTRAARPKRAAGSLNESLMVFVNE